MKSFIYYLSKIIPESSLRFLPFITRQKLIFPFYHTVSDKELIHIKHLYHVRNEKAFENDLELFLKYFEPISLADLLDSIHTKNPIKKKRFLLTFDDGLREFHDVIAPILLKKGIPAVCFLNSSFIDNADLFFRYKASIIIDSLQKQFATKNKNSELIKWFRGHNLRFDEGFSDILDIPYADRHFMDELAFVLGIDFNEYLSEQKPYMSSTEIHSLIDKGFSFGAHSMDHPQYSEITFEEQLHQTTESIQQITSMFHLEYKVFSFPFTDFDVSRQFFDTIFDPENKIADLTFGTAGIKKDRHKKSIQRIAIEHGNYTTKNILLGEYVYYILKTVVRKNYIKRLGQDAGL